MVLSSKPSPVVAQLLPESANNRASYFTSVSSSMPDFGEGLKHDWVRPVIIDLVHPAPNWGEAVSKLQANHQEPTFLAIVGNTGIQTVRSLWRLGIQGIVHRDDLEWEFTHAVEAVGNRQHYLSFTLIQNTPMPIKQQPRTAKRSDLSLRESQVLRLLARDLSNAQIADALDLSIRSVERLRTTLRQKLGFNHLHTGLMWAAKMKWV